MADARAEAARQLRSFLAAVARGELTGSTTHERAMLRRLEGAVNGLEAKSKRPRRRR